MEDLRLKSETAVLPPGVKKAVSIYERDKNILVGVAGKIVGSSKAEDAVQDVMVRILERKNLKEDNLRSYMMTSARNRAIDMYRHKVRGGEILESEENNGVIGESGILESTESTYRLPEDEALAITVGDELASVLEQIPDIHRDVVILRFVHGMSQREIAEELGVPIGTIKSRLSRGLENMGRILNDQGNY